MKTAPHIFRIGDRVRIITPDIFVRCGYPFDIQYAIDNLVTTDEKKIIQNLLEGPFFSFGNAQWRQNYHRMLRSLAHQRLCNEGFGGNERRIHTVNRPELAYVEGYVIGKRMVRTGKYSRGSYGSYGEDGEASELRNTKCHQILKIDLDNKSRDPDMFAELLHPIEIEKKHCELL